MKMIDLGHEYPTSPMAVEVEVEKKSRKDYPCIYLRGDQVPKDLPEGKFYAMVEMRVAGMRDPSDGDKSLDLELLSMSKPMDRPEGMDSDDDYEMDMESTGDGAIKAFRDTMSEFLKKSQVGQSG